ncbi:MAG: hypothetical protein CM15mP74_34920 [Halieaceae bacterium]|nr:MAG: hypothetical protein CM15mP74_34920 [Halieaceae bacterium]
MCALSQHRGDDRMPDSRRADLVILARQPEKEITLDLGAHRDRSRSCLYPLSRANRVVEEGLLAGLFPELMAPQANLQREALLGHRSRADFLIPASPDIFIEVKAVTLHLGGGRGAFPDAVSQRATRHIAELCDEMAKECRAALIFCVLHAGISSVQVAGHVDVVFAEALGHACARASRFTRSSMTSPRAVFILGTQSGWRR